MGHTETVQNFDIYFVIEALKFVMCKHHFINYLFLYSKINNSEDSFRSAFDFKIMVDVVFVLKNPVNQLPPVVAF